MKFIHETFPNSSVSNNSIVFLNFGGICMNFARFNVVLRPVRFLVIAFACGLLLLSNALPVFAANNPTAGFSSTRSNPTKGEEHFDEIYEKSEEALRAAPGDAQRFIEEANKGLNEVQGAGDIERMKSPENSQGTAIEKKVEEVLETITGRK
jgi:hypothetical protein